MIRGINVTQVAVSTPFDNSTDGWVANNTQAAIEEARFHLVGSQSHLTSAQTLTTSFVTLTGVTFTAGASGTSYLVLFTGDATSSSAGGTVEAGFYLAGAQIATSLRTISPLDGGALSAPSARGILGINAVIVTTGASQVIDVRATGSATSTVNTGTMTILRLT